MLILRKNIPAKHNSFTATFDNQVAVKELVLFSENGNGFKCSHNYDYQEHVKNITLACTAVFTELIRSKVRKPTFKPTCKQKKQKKKQNKNKQKTERSVFILHCFYIVNCFATASTLIVNKQTEN